MTPTTTVSVERVERMMHAAAPRFPRRVEREMPRLALAIAQGSARSPLWASPDGPLRTAALLTSIGYFESGFRVDALGDHGKSKGPFQDQGYGLRPGQDVRKDIDLAVMQAIRVLRTSLDACALLPEEKQLSLYASGTCSKGAQHSIHRVRFAKQLVERTR